MPRTKKKAEVPSSELTRCVCGNVFDLLKHKKCPSCGEKPVAREQNEAAIESAEEPPSDTTSDAQEEISLSPTTLRKMGIGALGLLLAAYLLKLIFGGAEPSDNPVVPQPQPRPNIQPTEDVTPSGTVDPALVGLWEQTINTELWLIAIGSNAQYFFKSIGPSRTVVHKGNFITKGNRWELSSRTMPWDDNGTYQTIGNDIFTMYGKLGTGQWRRSTRDRLRELDGEELNVPRQDLERSASAARRAPSRRGNSFRENNAILPPARPPRSRTRR